MEDVMNVKTYAVELDAQGQAVMVEKDTLREGVSMGDFVSREDYMKLMNAYLSDGSCD